MSAMVCPLLVAVCWLPVIASAQPPSFINFESGQVRPLAMAADGSALYAVNTPDARLEIFDLTGAAPRLIESVGVGLEPVAVALDPMGRAWVVNHLSDSVSIVDVAASPPRVVRTLLVGDEPRDVVFAGPRRGRAFITSAHRGQNHPVPRGDFDVEGVGRADVWVFDSESLGAPLGGTPSTILTLFADVPRALAVSPDGSQVYAAAFHSGNRTTAVSEGVVCDGGPAAGPCIVSGVSYPGGLPAPFENAAGATAPEVGLIVRQFDDDGPWLDELGRDWSAAVRFEMPDEDVFAIDAMANPPVQTAAFPGVGTTLFGMAVHPITGDVYVANTEAHNEVRFEGPGTLVRDMELRPGQPATVRGRLHEARITRIAGDVVTPIPLNPHIDYDASPQPEDTRWRSIATPNALAFSADGATLYVSALGSSAIGVIPTAELEAGTVSTDESRLISLRDPWPSGPSGVAVDDARGRLYALTRFDDSLVTIDLATQAVTARSRMHSPEPEAVVVGRPVLYDAVFTSSNGEASCASCHTFGDNDQLAWDLGDPDGVVLPNPNPRGVIGGGVPFHPMKGPMTTQSLRGMSDHGPMHWRGDRTAGHSGGDPLDERGAFIEFNGAFEALLGRDDGPLSPADMGRFADFAMTLFYPPNPIRRLDNSLRPDEARGNDVYFDRAAIDSVTTCNGCHVLDRSRGFFGGDGRTTFENEVQHFKVPHLRNAYTKVGMFGMPDIPFIGGTDHGSTGAQIRGFGYLHDGSVDTAERFFHATVFAGFADETERADMAAFMMAFDSLLAPIVGQQVTLGASATGSDVLSRALLLVERAQASQVWPGGTMAPECDLVVRGVVEGEDRGWLLEDDGMFHSDRAAEAPLTPIALLRRAGGGNILTATCVPPGSGARMAYDRDSDGIRDRDEIDAGDDPADRPPFPIPSPSAPPPMPMADAGPPDLDGGVASPDAGVANADGGFAADAGSTPPDDEEGCSCRAAGAGSHRHTPALALGLLGALLWRRRRRSVGQKTVS